jgi:membrane associated rhomboid family serine protease
VTRSRWGCLGSLVLGWISFSVVIGAADWAVDHPNDPVGSYVLGAALLGVVVSAGIGVFGLRERDRNRPPGRRD